MTQYRISQGSVEDWPGGHREGWWWHCYKDPSSPWWKSGYSPEGPFLTQAHALRHLINTHRAYRVARRTGKWPRMPANAGWASSQPTRQPRLKPLKGTRFFGSRLRAIIKEMDQ